MSGFSNLHAEVMEVFAELDGYRELHVQLDLWAWYRLQRNKERKTYASVKAWRKRHPERARAKGRRDSASYQKRNPAKRAAAKARWRKRYPDKARAQWRRNSAAYRARKRAAALAAAERSAA